MVNHRIAWNQKNLDYEIETLRGTDMPFDMRSLKSKEPRLRDWNSIKTNSVLPRRTSWNQKNLDYEIETQVYNVHYFTFPILKSKEPRLRDWNKCVPGSWLGVAGLEIKRTSITRLKPYETTADGHVVDALEIKRTSITRLKLWSSVTWSKPVFSTWNQKNLDYEIETLGRTAWNDAPGRLKSKEPRLRDWNSEHFTRIAIPPPVAWNQKNLDYEIETGFERCWRI